MNQRSTFNYMGTNNKVKGLPMTFSSNPSFTGGSVWVMDFVSYRFELVIVLRFFVPCWNIYKLQTDIEYTRVRGSIARYTTFASSIYVRRLQSNDKHFDQKCPTNRNPLHSPKAPFDTQSVTAPASSSFAAKRPEIHFCRETWVRG